MKMKYNQFIYQLKFNFFNYFVKFMLIAILINIKLTILTRPN